MNGYKPYVTFSREEWARLRATTPLTLTDHDLVTLRGLNEYVSLDEVADVCIHAPGDGPSQVQQGHITLGHFFCSLPGLTPATVIFHQAALAGYKPFEFLDKIIRFGIEKSKRSEFSTTN